MNIKTMLLSKPILKINALILGYCIWFIISQNQIITITKTVPLGFYNQPNNSHVYAPETVTITTSGKKNHVHYVFDPEYAIHVDLTHFSFGTHTIALTQKDLFLPQSINLIRLKPNTIQIKIAQ